MANDKDLKIGIKTEYDGSGAQAAIAVAERVKAASEAAAAATQQGGGSTAAGQPQDGGAKEAAQSEQELSKAREATAASAAKAGEASDALAKQRAESAKTAAEAATAEKPLQAAREETAKATTEAVTAEQEAAVVAETAADQKQAAAAQNEQAAEAEIKEIEALRAQMALEAKGRAELIKELERLNKARQEAAKAGDVKTFQALGEQIKQVRAAFQQMSQGLQITKLGMMGQMQVAMGAMGAMQSLGKEMQNGEVSIMGAANAVYALGAAIKAGMGPVGWLLMAIQGISMAWDYYSSKQEEARKKEKERMEEEQKALEEHWKAVEKFANADREMRLKAWKKEIEDIGKEQEKRNDEIREQQRRADIESAAAADRKRIAAQSAYDAEVARVELALTMGEITKEEARQRKAAAEEVKATELAAIEEAELLRTNKAHIEAKRRANNEANELEAALAEKYGAFEDILKVKLPTDDEWEALQLKLDANEHSMQEYVASREVQKKVFELRRMLEAMGIAWKGTDAELIKWVNSMREGREEGQKMVEHLRATAREEGDAALEVKRKNETRKEQDKADAERRKQTEELERAKYEKAEEEKNLREEWTEQQRKSLAEQEKWLEETASRFKEGSEEAKRWAKELRNVRAKQVAEEAGEIEKKFKVTGHYVERDARTQAAIYAADEKALHARKAALEKLKAAPDVDAATLKSINNKIKETDKQLRGLHQSMRQAAAEAQKAVANLKPLGQQAKVPTLQHSLRKTEKAYVALAKQAERQAAKGDTKGLERTLTSMNRMALAQERMTGYTGRAANLHKEMEGKLRNILNGTAAQDRGLTAEQIQENKVREQLGEKRKHTARAAAAAKKGAKAKEEEAKANEQAAQNARKNAQATKPTQQVNKTAQLAADVNSLRVQVQQMEAAQQKLNSNMGELSGAVGKLAASADRTAAIAGNMASAATSALGRLDSKNAALEKKVDRLARKIS